MAPPSRGRLKAGAFAPSVKAARGVADPPAFSLEGFLVGKFATAGFKTAGFTTAGFTTADLAATAFGALAVRGADFAGPDDFNVFDGALCDAFAATLLGCLFFAFLLDLVAVTPLVFEGAVFADFAD